MLSGSPMMKAIAACCFELRLGYSPVCTGTELFFRSGKTNSTSGRRSTALCISQNCWRFS
uniref:Uncharacterized protein n=2 Tax=Anguilla anguilla TaxID=7936 RepID=A0A0E9VVM1_ANGAN